MKDLALCVTEEECMAFNNNSKTWWVFQNECLKECPPKHELKNGSCVLCEDICHKVCPGTTVTNLDSIEQLNGCTNITGFLTIRLDADVKVDIEHELEKNLGYIEEIEEYLKISRSMPIKNLNFLRNLHTIKGKKLEQKRYAVLIHENQNLQKLWDPVEGFAVQNGTFSFHYNPKLCPSEIEHLARMTQMQLNYTSVDVSNHSNGDSFACSDVNIKVELVNITESSAVLQWLSPKINVNSNPVSKYLIYYKEVDDNDMFSEEEMCGIPAWVAFFAFNNENETTFNTVFSFNITGLKTFTNYTYFVRTDTRLGGRSEIQYFMTLSGDPSVPMSVTAEAVDSDAVRISWKRPVNTKGLLDNYIVVGFIQEDEQTFIDERNYCLCRMTEISSTTTEAVVETTTEFLDDSCVCKKEPEPTPTLIQKEDFDAICTDFDKITYNETRGGQSHGCASYKYQVIPSHKKYQESPKEKREETTLRPLDDKVNELIEDGVYHVFERHVPGNETSFVMRQLKHYTIYILLLTACNINRTEEPQCSSVVMVSQRTGRNPDADDISNLIAKVTNLYEVELEWSEPANPNAVIVSYDIEYVNLDSTNSKPVTHCITRKQHKLQNAKHKLKNIPPGQYELFVVANSLAGAGNPSNKVHFPITVPSQGSFPIAITSIATIFLVLCLVAYFIWHFKIKRKFIRRQLIANVNPDYAGYREDEWEMERTDIEIQQVLGQGSFGQVFSGTVRSTNLACAVKTVSDAATLHERMEFLNEATVMKAFNEAHHVVRLLGVVSKGFQPLVVMELMARGDLKSFLRSTRDSSTSLTCSEMYRMAAEIADGMAYLSAKKFVHRDLAARNCMVSADRTVKIGDFGMTRDIYETDYYRKETRGLLPVRWMAPESLADGVFTSDSDVWSYGIVLWEIATLAEQPYQGLANEQVLQFVVARGTLERPVQCPDLLYDIMIACWKWFPGSRPLFTDIVENVETHVGQDFRLVSFYHSRDGEDYRMNKIEINKARQKQLSAMPMGRVAAHWSRDADAVQFNAESLTDTPQSVSLLSCQHSPPNEYSPNPGTSYKPRLGS